MRPFATALLAFAAPLLADPPEHLGRSLSEWRADLESARGIERLLAARAIGEMAIDNREEAADALFEALDHDDSSVRYWAAVAATNLPGIGRAQAERLHQALGDAMPEVRIQAAAALMGTAREPEAIQTLDEMLSHRNRGVRLHAVHAIDAADERAAPLVDSLRAVLDDEFDYVRRVARHALWNLGERPCPYTECE